MKLTTFIGRTKISFKIPKEEPVGNSLKPPPGDQKFAVQPQDPNHTYWCWAAVMVSISRHLGLTGVWNQCELATKFLKDCKDCSATECDQTKFMGDILSEFSATKNSLSTKQGLPDFASLTKAIDKNRPIVCDGSRDGSLHAEVVCGYYSLAGQNFVVVSDPTGKDVYHDSLYTDYKCFASFVV